MSSSSVQQRCRTLFCTTRRRVTLWVLLLTLVVVVPALLFVFGRLGRGIDDFTLGTEGSKEVVKLSLDGNALRNAVDDPERDGWDTEVFNEAAMTQLKQFAKLLASPANVDVEQAEKFVTPRFNCDQLRPAPLKLVFDDSTLRVWRAENPQPSSTKQQADFQPGPTRLTKALHQLFSVFENSSDLRVTMKIFRIQKSGGTINTKVFFHAGGRTGEGSVEQTATWACGWVQSSVDQPPRLESIEIEDYEEIMARSAGKNLFSDCTEAVLGHNECFKQQLSFGVGHWLDNFDWAFLGDVWGHISIAVGDVNGDGLDDLYVCQPNGLPNRLFVHGPNGTATDVSAASGVDWLDHSMSTLLVDLDNDGDQDLIISTPTAVLFLSNDGTGQFTLRRSSTAAGNGTLAVADYDNDGDLDVYVCRYKGSSEPGLVEELPDPFYDANNGGSNRLLRNDGNWKFHDVTKESGLDANNHRFSLAASWEDYDNDGDPDMYVANDFGRNHLYRNDGGRFVDVAAEAGVEDMSSGMSVSWGDFNNDGLMDLYVSNMFSFAGNRIAYQRKFQAEANESTRAVFQRYARGNSLFQNTGDGAFRDVSVPAAVTMGRWAWGSLFVDLNNDGLEDLFVTNGNITNEQTKDL